jgi:hypothetical protein
MTTERSSYADEVLSGNAETITATREEEMASTGLSDAPYAGTTPSGDRLTDAATGVAEHAADTAQRQVGTQVEGQLARVGDALEVVANAVRQGADQLREQQPQMAGLADTAATQVDRASQFARESDFQSLLRETESAARRQPALFIGGAFVLGVVASRFLKASPKQPGGKHTFAGRTNGYDR